MAKNSPLDKLTIKEVDSIIRKSKNIKDAANKIGVPAQDLYMYRSKNMKEFRKLKAEREQGLIFDDEPLIQTKPVEEKKSEPVINKPALETVEKAMYDDLLLKLNDLDSEHDTLTKSHETNSKELEQQKKENERLRDQIERLKKNKAEAEEQQRKATSKLNERSKIAEDAMRAATMRIEQLEETVGKQDKIIDRKNGTIKKNVFNALKIEEVQTQLEQERAEEVARYEQALKQLEHEVQQLGTERDDWKGKYLDLDNAYRALEEESKTNVTVINPPSHYAPSGTGTDVIGFLETQFSYEAYKGFMVGNIIKYATRTGRKDEEIQELRKIIDYGSRMIHHLEKSDVVDAG